LKQVIVSAVVKFEARHGLRMTAIEAFGEPKNRRQGPHGAAQPPR
jgi:hypothetical protein